MKLKDKKGLTLVEMLCTVAILVLVSMVMVLGVQLGVRSYAKSVSYSEAQVLCSTLTTTISDELRYSGTLKVDGSGSVTGFFSQQFGSGDYTAFTTTPEGHVQLGGKDILPAKAYPYGIKAEVGSLTYDDVTALFTVQLSVKDSENKNTLAETTFEVEKLNVTTEDTAEGRARAEDIRNARKIQSLLGKWVADGTITCANDSKGTGVWVLVCRDGTSYPGGYDKNYSSSVFFGTDPGVYVNKSTSTTWKSGNTELKRLIEAEMETNLELKASATAEVDNIGGWDWYVVQYVYDKSTKEWSTYLFSGMQGKPSEANRNTEQNSNMYQYMNRNTEN